MSVTKVKGGWPHTAWIDLKGDGVLVECAVLKEDGFGNTFFIEIPSLDGIDKGRLVKILHRPGANNFELWDLMSQVTLNNGLNALEYFHQLTRIITPAGVVMNPRAGTVGTGKVDTNPAKNAAETADVVETPKRGRKPAKDEK